MFYSLICPFRIQILIGSRLFLSIFIYFALFLSISTKKVAKNVKTKLKMLQTKTIIKQPLLSWTMKRSLPVAIRPIHMSSSSLDKNSRRDKLIKEKGYFHEMVELNKTGGKLFVASNELSKPSASINFPSFQGDSISNGSLVMPSASIGKVSLVGISFKQYGFEQIISWMEPLQNEYNIMKNTSKPKSKHRFQIMYFSMTEGGMLASLLRGSMKSGLSKTIPREFHDTSVVYVGVLDKICEKLNIDNRLVGHMFLLDEKARVRWHGCGDATEEELVNLVKLIGELQA